MSRYANHDGQDNVIRGHASRRIDSRRAKKRLSFGVADVLQPRPELLRQGCLYVRCNETGSIHRTCGYTINSSLGIQSRQHKFMQPHHRHVKSVERFDGRADLRVRDCLTVATSTGLFRPAGFGGVPVISSAWCPLRFRRPRRGGCDPDDAQPRNLAATRVGFWRPAHGTRARPRQPRQAPCGGASRWPLRIGKRPPDVRGRRGVRPAAVANLR